MARWNDKSKDHKIQTLTEENALLRRQLDEETQRRQIAQVQATEWRSQLENAKFTADYWQRQAAN